MFITKGNNKERFFMACDSLGGQLLMRTLCEQNSQHFVFTQWKPCGNKGDTQNVQL